MCDIVSNYSYTAGFFNKQFYASISYLSFVLHALPIPRSSNRNSESFLQKVEVMKFHAK
jgi:hypothetical protein